MLRNRASLWCSILILGLAARASGDSVAAGTQVYDGTLNGIRNGRLSITLKTGEEKAIELGDVTAVALDPYPKFAEAERLRETALLAEPVYRSLITTINKPELRVVAQWRAIDATDRNNRWVEAVELFLDVYSASPTAAVWKARPTRWPKAGSKLLADSAAKVELAVKAAKTEEARRNLRTWLLEIYTKSEDAAAAQRVARELDSGASEAVPAAATSLDLAAQLIELNTLLQAGKQDDVVRRADALLTTATGEPAAQLYSLKARALEAQGKSEAAAGAWLRIAAHYPESPAAPAALQQAAAMQQKLNRAGAAKTLRDELRVRYPASREARELTP